MAEASHDGASSSLPLHPAQQSLGSVASGLGERPHGWPHGGETVRGGLFEDRSLVEGVADALTGRTSASGSGSPSRGLPRGLPGGLHNTEGRLNTRRPEAPVLAYVDRAAFPGFVDPDEYEGHLQQSARDVEYKQVAAWQGACVVREALAAAPAGPAQSLDEWEAELLEWKLRYGCAEVAEVEVPAATAAALLNPAACESEVLAEAGTPRELPTAAAAPAAFLAPAAPPEPPPDMDTDISPEEMRRRSMEGVARGSGPPCRPETPERGLDGAVAAGVARETELPAAEAKGDRAEASPPEALAEPAAAPAAAEAAAGQVPTEVDGSAAPSACTRVSSGIGEGAGGAATAAAAAPTSTRLGACAAGASEEAQIEAQTAQMLQAFAAEGPSAAESPPLGRAAAGSLAAEPPPSAAAPAPVAPSGPRPKGSRPLPGGAAVLPATGLAAGASVIDAAGQQPAAPGGRYMLYTQQDLDQATTTALGRLGPGGTWRSGYGEAGLQKRDFFADLQRQREKDKGRLASGPIWAHLAMQAKNLASTLDLGELLQAMKLFCSVRFEDYELYMRMLGEMPHYIKNASTDQLCELIRLLARRRLRERNYVDMVAAQFLQKIRITDEALPARLLVKTANAFAALECRSQPKFVEHFLRHFEHRIEELDVETCCMVSPLFVANYMSDALRRAYLKRCAESQAGFQGPEYELRNMACTELVLRKEHHSFLASVPAYVGRYLEKVREHALFDRWGSVTLPPAVAPDGPKGSHRSEMSLSLQHKASTAAGGTRGDVFNSDMHRDVSACLTHLGIEHENGVLCGPYLLDVVALDMVNPTKRIVYEVNSPHHFYEGTHTLTAEKRLRHRMLGRLGQKLHMVNAEDWCALTAAHKMTFILKLQQAQQDTNTQEAKQQALANTMRAPLPALRPDSAGSGSKPRSLVLKSSLNSPIRVPVPPSRKGQQLSLTAR